jgi:hypothetical protein
MNKLLGTNTKTDIEPDLEAALIRLQRSLRACFYLDGAFLWDLDVEKLAPAAIEFASQLLRFNTAPDRNNPGLSFYDLRSKLFAAVREATVDVIRRSNPDLRDLPSFRLGILSTKVEEALRQQAEDWLLEYLESTTTSKGGNRQCLEAGAALQADNERAVAELSERPSKNSEVPQNTEPAQPPAQVTGEKQQELGDGQETTPQALTDHARLVEAVKRNFGVGKPEPFTAFYRPVSVGGQTQKISSGEFCAWMREDHRHCGQRKWTSLNSAAKKLS